MRGKTKVFIGAFVIVFILIFSGRLLFGLINKDGVSGVSADSWPMFRHDLAAFWQFKHGSTEDK